MRRFLLLPTVLLTSLHVLASPVDESHATTTARKFFAAHGINMPSQAKANARKASSSTEKTAAWYAFNGDGQGFVIVSGDDRTVPVLGYSLSGIFDYDSAPDNMKAWLDTYADQISYLQSKDVKVTPSTRASATREKIEPLMQSKWNQSEPYNNSCPDFFSYGKCVTGCVATAMAQLLYYNYQQYPNLVTQSVTADIPSYTCATNWSGFGKISVDGVSAGTTIDWANMLTSYTSSATDTQKKAVADLMAWCGASVEMNYANSSNSGSSASSLIIPQALVKYFNIDRSVQVLNRAAFTQSDWNDRVYEELKAKRVVLYSGTSSQGSGHSFIIDGYDGDNYFDVNWGWGGYCDGAFLLSVLSPEAGGIGAGNVAEGYNQNMQIIVNAMPDQNGTEPMSVVAHSCSIEGTKVTYTASNWGIETNYYMLGFAIVTDNELQRTGTFRDLSMPHPQGTRYTSTDISCDFASSNLADGTYKIVPAACHSGNGDWQSLWSENHYLSVTVSNGNVTVTEMPAATLSASNLTVGNIRKTGVPCNISAEVTNSGTEEFSGTLYLFASATEEKGSSVTASDAYIVAGAAETVMLSWTPSEAGTYNLWLCADADGKNVLCQGSVVIEQGEVTQDEAVSITAVTVSGSDITSQTEDADGRIVTSLSGNAIEGSYSIKLNKNFTTSTDFFVSLFKYDTQSNTYQEYPRTSYTWNSITGSKGLPASVTFTFTNLPDGKYMLKIAAGTFNRSSFKIDSEIWSNDKYCYAIGTATGIDSIKVADKDVVVYNISGMRIGTVKASALSGWLSTLPKGVYIVNGKKILNK